MECIKPRAKIVVVLDKDLRIKMKKRSEEMQTLCCL